jgi:hypothetical protein
MLILCDLRVLGCLTHGRARFSLSFMAFLRRAWASSNEANMLGESNRGEQYPVDRPVGTDQRDDVQVAEHAVLCDRG